MSSPRHREFDGRRVTRAPAVYVVDDDQSTRDLFRLLLKMIDVEAAIYALPSDFIAAFDPDRPGCVVLDLLMPESNGVETLTRLRAQSSTVPVVMISGHGDLATVVRCMKLGAVEFLEKPLNKELVLETIRYWTRWDTASHQVQQQHKLTLARLEKLSSRERQVLECVLDGMSNKETARHLGVSPKAVELYRAKVMHKMEATNIVTLVVQVAGCLKRDGRIAPRPSCFEPADQGDPAGGA